MSNNFLSQQLSSILNKELGQMEPSFSGLDSSISKMGRGMGMMGPTSNSPASQQLAISDQQTGLMGPISDNHGLQRLPVSNRQMGHVEPNTAFLGSHQFLMADRQVGDMEAMLNLGSQKLLLPGKRKASEPLTGNYVPPQLSIPNKHVSETDPFVYSPGLQQRSAPIKKPVQIQTMSTSTPGLQNSPAQNKKMVRNESTSGRSGSQQTPRNRTVQTVPSPKVQTESFESVRSKMRESLAAALALVSHHQDKTPNEEKNSQSEVKEEDSRPESSTTADAANHGNHMGTFPSTETCQSSDGNKEKMVDYVQVKKFDGQEFLSNTVLRDEDDTFTDNFFVKDDLLQGNGLSWALDHDMEAEETKEVQPAKKPKLLHDDVSGDKGEQEQAVRSPENLSFNIEAELFKLFGGVNKKYKEKGRSLLFNLKDRNNPELREKVMSGDITPERLCSMTAEELASKELSEWRMAKAEELAQMVVLPDSDVDIRRLVRKTHKGEFQVEVEQDDGVSVDVSVGTTLLTRTPSKKKDTEAQTSSKSGENKEKEDIHGDKGSLGNQDLSSSLTIPSDGSDLMQGLMVDEFKDAEFLPPIVSLDEFMESLDSEPPFENLRVDAEKSEASYELVASDPPSNDSIVTTTDKVDKKHKAEEIDMKHTELDVKVKSRESPVKLKTSPRGGDVKHTELDVKVKSSESPVKLKTSPCRGATDAERVWEGVLQLNISATVTAVGFLRSGEKTSTKEWPSSLEIKGRVRLDAFEKFIQDLRMSRSRAVMITQFVLKEGSSEDDRASLCEVVDSYVLDERLGFAEPAPGMEIYFCPHHTKILEILGKHLPKNYTETLKSTNNGLIGVIVWRKAHISSTMSPNSSSSHHKKQHFSSTRRHQERDTNVNVNFASKRSSLGPPPNRPQPEIDDEIDDIPPGFGPPAARDDDDLPEFNFLNPPVPKVSTRNRGPNSNTTPFNSLSQAPVPPVDHVRSLIHKYGQPENNVISRNLVVNKRWNEDDDDDMPEWNPQAPQPQLLPQPQPQPPPRHSFEQPMHVVNQHIMVQATSQVVQPPINNAMHGGFWPPQQSVPYGSQHNSNLGTQPPSGGQYQGWRHNAPRSRGF